jgi:hypothetical protein
VNSYAAGSVPVTTIRQPCVLSVVSDRTATTSASADARLRLPQRPTHPRRGHHETNIRT